MSSYRLPKNSRTFLLQVGAVLLLFAWYLVTRRWVNATFDAHLMSSLQMSPYDWGILLLFVLLLIYLIIFREYSIKELEVSESRFKSLFDKSRDGIMLTNPNGQIMQANQAACEILGMEEDEICSLGRDGLVIKDAHLERALKIRQDTGNFSGELTFRHKSGRQIPVDITSSIFTMNNGRDKRTSLIFRDISAQKDFQNALKDTLDKRTFLLEEIHHRIKNNLSIVSGLLELQILNNPDLKDVLVMSQNRIQSIAEVHGMLYNTDNFNSLDVREYVNQLVDRVRESLNIRVLDVDIQLDIDPFELGINSSVPFGLMLNELITNSFKHAFEEVENAKVMIKLKKEADQISFSYQDNGKGIPGISDAKDISTKTSLGLKLITVLSNQLDARDIDLNGNNGFSYQFKFSLKAHENEEAVHSN